VDRLVDRVLVHHQLRDPEGAQRRHDIVMPTASL
jgi:hypothetical protein